MKMCKDCVKDEFPERDSICLEKGAYFVNFNGCVQCQRKDTLEIINREQVQEEDEETITYDHICKNCDHKIATHEYHFKVEDEYQEYEMWCLLCGRGDDTRSIMPDDPRKNILF